MDKKFKTILYIFGLLFLIQFALILYLFNTRPKEALTILLPDQTAILGISSQAATEIALDYIGEGTIYDVTLINESGVAVYQVDMTYDEIRFLIYVGAESGEVLRMIRFEEGYEGITTLPEVIPSDGLDIELDE